MLKRSSSAVRACCPSTRSISTGLSRFSSTSSTLTSTSTRTNKYASNFNHWYSASTRSNPNLAWLTTRCNSHSARGFSSATSQVDSEAKEAIPWFLQEEESVDRPSQVSDESTNQLIEVSPISPDEILELSHPNSTSIPTTSLPYQLEQLRAHLLTSSSSSLLSRNTSQEKETLIPSRGEEEHDQENPDFRFGDSDTQLESEQRKPLKNQIKFKRTTPLRFINSNSISQDDSYVDWIVIVQVRGQGMVARVAKDIGEFLKYIPPPPSLDTLYPSAIHDTPPQDPLDQLLGPNSTSSSNPNPSSKGKEKVPTEEEILGPRPPGMSRIEWREGRKLKEWEIQKLALKNKLRNENNGEFLDEEEVDNNISTSTWKPKKILSREAQDGIRLLNQSNPTLFNSESLSEKFGISKESIRRILKAESEPDWMKKSKKSKFEEDNSLLDGEGEGEEVVEGIRERQNRRANERLIERREELRELARKQQESSEIRAGEVIEGDRNIREEVEFERITKMIQDEISSSSSATISNSASPIIDSTPTPRKPLNQIFYEGLIDSSSSDSSSSSVSNSKKKSSLKSSKSRGIGDWCLIDSGWCIVHVMTEESREKWDLERNWERKLLEARRERESLEAN